MNENLQIQAFPSVTDALLDEIDQLELAIFESPYSREKIERELTAKHNPLSLIAYIGERPVGFKVGFEITAEIFYSWIGGVHPDFRGRGIARKLMREQHERIAKTGYRFVRTCTENRFKPMLLLNLHEGFDIIGIYQAGNNENTSIMLEKVL